jgi:SdrD B-like domain
MLSFEPTLNAEEFGVGKGKLSLSSTIVLRPFNFGPGVEKTQHIGYIAMAGDVHGITFLDRDASGKHFGNEPGISGVPVILVQADGEIAGEGTTEPHGGYLIPNIQPGKYTLRFNQIVSSDKYGELSLTTPESQEITVELGETTEATPVGYKPEVHEIRGQVVFEDDTPVFGLVVTLLDKDGLKELDTAVTKKDGFYVFKDREGDFQLKFPERPFDGQLLTPKERPAHVESIFNAPKTIYRLTGDSAGGATVVSAAGGTIQDAVSDIASYMPTAQEVTSPMPRRGTWGATGAPASL